MFSGFLFLWLNKFKFLISLSLGLFFSVFDFQLISRQFRFLLLPFWVPWGTLSYINLKITLEWIYAHWRKHGKQQLESHSVSLVITLLWRHWHVPFQSFSLIFDYLLWGWVHSLESDCLNSSLGFASGKVTFCPSVSLLVRNTPYWGW